MVGQGQQGVQFAAERFPWQAGVLGQIGQCLHQAFDVLLAYDGLSPAPFGDRSAAALAEGLANDLLQVLVVGWWMVTSGLSADVKVSHLRLATHLGVALLTLGALVWTALDVLGLRNGRAPARITRFTAAVLAILAVQVLFGAFVAGMRAGYVAGMGWFAADAWPLMQGSFFPEGVGWSQGVFHALTNDPFLVHFVHRWWAFVLVAALVVLARKVRASGRRDVSIAIHSAFGTQILLGIATVWSGMELWLAVLHQLTGALVVAATVWGAHVVGRSEPAR